MPPQSLWIAACHARPYPVEPWMFGTTSAMPRCRSAMSTGTRAGRDWPSGPPCGTSTAGIGALARRGRYTKHGIGPSGPGMRTRSGSTSSPGVTARRRHDRSSLARTRVEHADLPRIARAEAHERRVRPVARQDEVVADAAQVVLADATVATPAQLRVAVRVHGPDLDAAIGRRRGELDVPLRRVDALAGAAPRIERGEVEMLALLVGDLEDSAIREPARPDVLRIVAVPRDLARGSGGAVDDEQILSGVVEDAHDEQRVALGRPAPHDVPRRSGGEDPLAAARGRREHDVHVRGRAGVRREGDGPPVR